MQSLFETSNRGRKTFERPARYRMPYPGFTNTNLGSPGFFRPLPAPTRPGGYPGPSGPARPLGTPGPLTPQPYYHSPKGPVRPLVDPKRKPFGKKTPLRISPRGGYALHPLIRRGLRMLPGLGWGLFLYDLYGFIEFQPEQPPVDPHYEYPNGVIVCCDLGPPYNRYSTVVASPSGCALGITCGVSGQVPEGIWGGGPIHVNSGHRFIYEGFGLLPLSNPAARFTVSRKVYIPATINPSGLEIPFNLGGPEIPERPAVIAPEDDPFNPRIPPNPFAPSLNPPWPPLPPYFRHPLSDAGNDDSSSSEPMESTRPRRPIRYRDLEDTPVIPSPDGPMVPAPTINLPPDTPPPDHIPWEEEPHILRPPGPGEKEIKVRIGKGKFQRLVNSAANIWEVDDLVESIYQALPFPLRMKWDPVEKKWKKRDRTLQDKVRRIAENMDVFKVRKNMAKAAQNLAINEIVDFGIGKIGRALKRAVTKAARGGYYRGAGGLQFGQRFGKWGEPGQMLKDQLK